MKPGYRFYRVCYRLARFAIGIFYRIVILGAENIPEGAAMICANHSSNIDPFLVVFAFGIDNPLHIIAKAELFRIPVISPILKKLGMIRVDRDTLDAAAIKSSLGFLKAREKVVIFPEGTRVFSDGGSPVKIGAVKLAHHANVPIVPVYIPRKKPVPRKVTITIGKPYSIDGAGKKLSPDEYATLTGEMMDKIRTLGQ